MLILKTCHSGKLDMQHINRHLVTVAIASQDSDKTFTGANTRTPSVDVTFVCGYDLFSPCHSYPDCNCDASDHEATSYPWWPGKNGSCEYCDQPSIYHDKCWAEQFFATGAHLYDGDDFCGENPFHVPLLSRTGPVFMELWDACVNWVWDYEQLESSSIES